MIEETLSGVKCINNSRIGIVILIVCTFLVTGCSQTTYGAPYVTMTSIAPTLTSSLSSEYVLTSFASDLCVLSSETETYGITMDVEELSGVGLFDLSQQDVLYAKNIHTTLYPASLTKVMTAIVVLKYADLDTVITVTEPIVFDEWGVTTIGIEAGDQLTMEQALHLLLICSANDAAVIIANEIGGSIEGFSELMNEEALLIGATNTNFVNPHGLHDDNQYTTVYDMYLIMNEAITYSKFNDITSMSSYNTVTYNTSGTEVAFECNSSNRFILGTEEAPSGIVVAGGKTGTTEMAGHCLVIHGKDSSGNSYIAIILNAPQRDLIYEKMIELLSEI